MSRLISPDLLRQLSSEPPVSSPATSPEQRAQDCRRNRRSGPDTRVGILATPDLTAWDVEGLVPWRADAPDPDDELGLLPLIDMIVVEAQRDAKPDAANTTPLLVDRLLSTAEAAAFFGREPRTLHRWRQRGLIRAVRVGAALFYVGADIDALIRSRLTTDVVRACNASKSGALDHG